MVASAAAVATKMVTGRDVLESPVRSVARAVRRCGPGEGLSHVNCHGGEEAEPMSVESAKKSTCWRRFSGSRAAAVIGMGAAVLKRVP